MHGKPGILLLGCKLDRGSVLQNLGCCVHDDEGIDAALTHAWAIYCRRRARQLWFQQDGISLVETLLNARQRIGEYTLLFMMAFLKDLVMSHSDGDPRLLCQSMLAAVHILYDVVYYQQMLQHLCANV